MIRQRAESRKLERILQIRKTKKFVVGKRQFFTQNSNMLKSLTFNAIYFNYIFIGLELIWYKLNYSIFRVVSYAPL